MGHDGSSRPTRVRYAVLAVFCSLAFLTYLDRICIMRVQDDIVRDLDLGRLTVADEQQLAAEGNSDDDQAREKRYAARGKERMSWIFVAFTVGYLLFEVPGGWLGDRWGPRRVLFRIVLWWSLFTALTGSADTLVRLVVAEPGPWLLVAALVVVRFLFGSGEAGAYPNIGRVMGRWFPYRQRGTANGAIWMASRIGGALAPTIIGLLMVTAGGWRQAFWVLGIIGAVWAFLFLWWFRDRPDEMPGVNPAEAALIRGSARVGSIHDDQHGDVPWRRLLTSTNLWALYIAHSCICFSWFFFITFISKFLKERFDLDFAKSELQSGLPLLAGGVTCLIGGRLSDWLVRRTGSRRWGRSLVGSGSLLVAGLLTFFVPHASTATLGVVLLCLVSAAQDLMVPVMWSLPADIGGRHAGTLGGAMNMAGGFGGILGTLTSGYISSDRFGWDGVFVLFGAAYLLAAVLWLRIDASEPFERIDENSP